jgi:hypothetical protein
MLKRVEKISPPGEKCTQEEDIHQFIKFEQDPGVLIRLVKGVAELHKATEWREGGWKGKGQSVCDKLQIDINPGNRREPQGKKWKTIRQ